MSTVLIFATVYVIFQNDVTRAVASPRLDMPLEVVTTLFLGLFAVEIGK